MLTPKQARLVEALLAAPTVRVACQRAKVAERSYRDWAKQDEFAEVLATARKAALAEAVGVLQGLMTPAARTLRKCLRSNRDGDRIKAAVAILDRAMRG